MKKLLFVLLSALFLVSCGYYTRYNVKLSNGSIVSALEEDYRNWKSGDTVCIYSSLTSDRWTINNTGIMRDTTVLSSYKYTDGTSKEYIIIYHIGIVQ
jgi:hypothetical protein